MAAVLFTNPKEVRPAKNLEQEEVSKRTIHQMELRDSHSIYFFSGCKILESLKKYEEKADSRNIIRRKMPMRPDGAAGFTPSKS